MSTIVFFTIPAHGHINPNLPLIAELVTQGKRVICYATAEFQSKIERAGALYRPYPRMKYDVLLDGNPIHTLARLLETGEHLIPPLLAELKADSVDYVMYDAIANWGKYVVTAMQAPAISCTVTFVLNQVTARELGSPLAFVKMFSSGGIAASHELIQRVNRLNQRYNGGNGQLSDAFVNRGDLNIVYTSQLFQPHSEQFDDSYCFVGPSLPASSPPSDFPMERLQNGRSLLYISLGTLFNDHIGFYRACIEAFGGRDYQVVMSIGKKIDTAVLDAPDNFIIVNYAPQIDILKRADLFITHGGMNSVSEGLFFNVPLLVYPQMIEQGFVAKRVTDVGAGRRLKENELDAVSLRKHAAVLLTDGRYRQAAKTIGESLRGAGGYKRAAAEILRLRKG